MKIAVFRVVAPCTRLHGATTQKTAIFIDVHIYTQHKKVSTYFISYNILRWACV
jgi:hypothetical protein